MNQEETAAWMWSMHEAFDELGGYALPVEDVDFWMMWIGSVGIEDTGLGFILNLLDGAEQTKT